MARRKTGFNPADNDRFRSNTGKKIKALGPNSLDFQKLHSPSLFKFLLNLNSGKKKEKKTNFPSDFFLTTISMAFLYWRITLDIAKDRNK